jgi:hypothetical protein
VSRAQVVTLTPSGHTPRVLGSLGHVRGLNYSYALPGGCDQLTCTLLRPPTYRTDALEPGRLVRVYVGASIVWDGQMLEPAPGDQGWTITAIGTAGWGNEYIGLYPGKWAAGITNTIVNQAISRGLRWVNPGIGTPPGAWEGQAVDSGAQSVTDALNLFCSNGGLTWYVGRGNLLTVFALPTTVNRLLVATSPVARTLGGNFNTIYLRYGATADTSGSPATYATTSSQDAASIARFGSVQEDFVDLSSVGVISAATAQGVGAAILKRYQRASYAGPFTVSQGQLLNTGGQAIDLAQEQAGNVVKLLMTDFAYGAEEAVGPVTFLVGNYAYDDDSETATVTPFQALGDSIGGVSGEPWVTRVTRADKRFARAATKKAVANAARKAARAKRAAAAKDKRLDARHDRKADAAAARDKRIDARKDRRADR